jgi:anti-anti-sigma factor
MAEIERLVVDEDLVLVVIRGEFDLADEPRADLAIDFVVNLAAPKVMVDLSQCEFVDATGLRILLRAQRRIRQAGSRVVFAGPTPPVRRILDLTGVGETLAIAEDRDAALAALGVR